MMKKTIKLGFFALLFLLFTIGVSAQDSELTITDIVIIDLDVEDDGNFLYFVGENISNDDIFLGKVKILGGGGLGSFSMRKIGSVVDGNVLSIDEQNGILWIGFYDMIQRWSNLGGSVNGILSASNTTYTSSGIGSYFREVLARPFYSSVMFACRIDSPYGSGDFQGVETFYYNGSSVYPINNVSLENSSVTSVCRGLAVKDSKLFVDNSEFGIQIYSVAPNHSLSLDSDNDNRVWSYVGNPYFDRSDLIGLGDDYMFVHDGGTINPYTAEAIQRVDITNTSSPVYNNSQCILTGSTSLSKVQNIEVFNDSNVLFVDMYDSSIYLCEFYENTTTFAVEVWDSPDVAFYGDTAYGDKLGYYSDGFFNYFFTSNGWDSLLMFELKTYFDEGLNSMPYFVVGTPDRQFVDNLNPIAVGVESQGLDTPLVNVYPLTCRNPDLYECSKDFEGDDILFAVDPAYNGTFTSPAWHTFEDYSTTYSSAGNYTMRIYITDDQHSNVYLVYRDINISVSGNVTPLGENESTLKFIVKDSVSGVVLPSAYVDVSAEGSGWTDTDGKFLEIVYEGVWLVEFSLDGYVTQTNYYSSSPIWQEVLLELQADPDRRTLIVTVQDDNATLLSNIFVQIQMPLITSFDYKFTDAIGRATFFPDDESVVVVVDHDDYDPVSFEVFVPLGSTVSRLVTLSPIGANITALYEGQSGFSLTGCQDYIKGVVLCDYDNVSCTVDSDCVTGKCSYNGQCSNFNWKLCDEQNIQRGNRCIFKNVATGVLRGVGDWILDNFFYVLIIILLLVTILIFALRNK